LQRSGGHGGLKHETFTPVYGGNLFESNRFLFLVATRGKIAKLTHKPVNNRPSCTC
jgi:hypothetical protein